MKHYERDFEETLKENAPLFNMLYLKIPDFIHAPMNKIIAHKRPFDGVLVTPNGNYLIECKINYAPQKEHQKILGEKITKVNKSYFVVRKINCLKGCYVKYRVEQNEFVFVTNKIEDIFKFFTDPQEHYSQTIMMDNLLPTKKKRLRRVLL